MGHQGFVSNISKFSSSHQGNMVGKIVFRLPSWEEKKQVSFPIVSTKSQGSFSLALP